MPRLLRDTDPEKIHLITTRCERAELLLVPCNELNGLVGGIIARYALLNQIEIYSYCVLSNHYHIVARGPLGNLSEFAGNINREIAKRVNQYLGRKGHFWSCRYHDSVTIKECDAVEAVIYTLTNPTKHGLVHDPSLWPGLTSYSQQLRESIREYKFMDFSAYSRALKRAQSTGEIVRRSDFETSYELKVLILPSFRKLSKNQRADKLLKLIKKRTKKLQLERKAKGKGFLGRKAVLRQKKMGTFPREVSHEKLKNHFCVNDSDKKQYLEEQKAKREAYSIASFLFRLGHFETKFPPFCFKPPMHYIPKTKPPTLALAP